MTINLTRAELCELASKKRLRDMEIDRIWRSTFGRELLPRKAKSQTFKLSDPAKEHNPDAWLWARAWKFASGNGWIHGTVGAGKTYLARAIAIDALTRGITVAETTGSEWCDRSGDFKWQEHRNRLSRVHLLIFDDIDKGTWRESSLKAFTALAGIRYDAGRRTIVTSNPEPRYMVNQIWRKVQGDNDSITYALTDRLKPCRRWKLTGKSLRKG